MGETPKRVEILDRDEVFKQYIFRIEKVTLKHERYDGVMSRPIVRLNLDRGDSTAAIVHNLDNDTVLLTEQFRIATYRGSEGTGWLREIPAGMVENGEDPKTAMIRELEEEIGYRVSDLEHIATFYLSPGGTSERIHLYYAGVRAKFQVNAGGGVVSEDEDIRTLEVSVRELFRQMERGEINDAKTLIGLQWLYMNGKHKRSFFKRVRD